MIGNISVFCINTTHIESHIIHSIFINFILQNIKDNAALHFAGSWFSILIVKYETESIEFELTTPLLLENKHR